MKKKLLKKFPVGKKNTHPADGPETNLFLGWPGSLLCLNASP